MKGLFLTILLLPLTLNMLCSQESSAEVNQEGKIVCGPETYLDCPVDYPSLRIDPGLWCLFIQKQF